MTAYGIGIVENLQPGNHLVEYLEKIDETLEPYGGRFIVHGADPIVREGAFSARFVVMEFPDLDRLKDWYDSPGYAAILGLRADYSDSTVFFVEGLDGPHVATEVLKAGVHYEAI